MWNELFAYAAKSAIVLTLLYAPYTLLLRKEHFFRQNRLTLVGILVLSLTLPFINLQRRYIIMQPSLQSSAPVVMNVEAQPVEPISIDISEPTSQTSQPVAVSQPTRQPIDYVQWLCILYIIGVSVAVGIRFWQFVRMDRLIRRGCLWHDTVDGITIYCHASDIAPYSWMRRIVISQHDYDNHRHEILLHERGHVLCHHSWDILLLMLVQTVQWFNPFVYMFGASLRDVHEYEADDYVLRQGVSAGQYQTLLLKTAVGASAYSFANNFNHSKIKSRIVMMKNNKINPWMRCKVLYILPVIFISLSLFATPKKQTEFLGVLAPSYQFPKRTSLDDIFYCYDGRVVSRYEFMSLLESENDSTRDVVCINKNLKKHLRKLDTEIFWIEDSEAEIDEAMGLLRLFRDARILNGALVARKNSPTPPSNPSEKWFPRGAVSSLDDVLLLYDGKMMKTREFERMVTQEYPKGTIEIYGINQEINKHLHSLGDVEVTWVYEELEYDAALDLLLEFKHINAMNGALIVRKKSIGTPDSTFPEVSDLDDVLILWDRDIIDKETFLRLMKKDYTSTDVMHVANKRLESHLKSLYPHTIMWIQDPEIVKNMYQATGNKKAFNGMIFVEKLNEKQRNDNYISAVRFNFALEGHVSSDIKDVAYKITLEDGVDAISQQSECVVYVKDGKFSYHAQLDKPTNATIRAIFADGSLCEAYIEQVFVPGEKLNILVMDNKFVASYTPFTESKSESQSVPFSEWGMHPSKREEQPQEIAVQVRQGKQKEKKLFGRGTRVPGTSMQYTPNQIGQEIGTALTIARPTEIREFSFDVLSCNIKDAVMGINIYRADTDTKFIGPILANVEQGKKQTIGLRPVESFVLEPGEYIVSIGLVDCDEETKALWASSHQWNEEQRREMAKQSSLQLPFYVKESYIRRDASDTFEKRNINVGLQAKGVEY
mgnify:CR=1 FL=1